METYPLEEPRKYAILLLSGDGSALESFVSERPDNVDAWIVLGFVRYFTGDRELATRTFELVKRQSPADAGLANVFLKK